MDKVNLNIPTFFTGGAETMLGHYQNLVEAAGDVMYTCDWRGYCTYVNAAVKRFFGYEPEEVVGHIFTDFIHPDWREEIFNYYVNQFQQRIHQTTREFQALTRAGEVKWVEQIVILQIDAEKDRVAGFMGFVRDITERKRAEEQLRQSQNTLRAIIDAVPDHIYVKDLHHRFWLVNQSTWQNEGYDSADAMIGKTDYDLYGPDGKADWDAEEDLLKTGDPIINDERINTRMPESRRREVVLINKVPLYGEDGKISGLIGINRDITERKRTDEQLQQSINTLTALVETSTDLIFVKDRDLRYIIFNPAGVRMMGRPPEEILDKTDYDLFGKTVGDEMGAIDRHVLETGESTTYEIERPLAGGNRWLLITKYPLLSADGEVQGIVGIGHDITARKHAEAALAVSEANLSTLMNNTADSIFSMDTERRLITFNKNFERRFLNNFGLQLVPGMRMEDHVPKKMAEDWVPWLTRALSGERFSIEYRYVSEGVVGYTDVNFNPITDAGGNITGVAVFNRDVTERKRAEAALQASEANLSALMNNATDSIFSGDKDMRILTLNAVFKQRFNLLFGVEIDVGTRLPDVVPPEIGAQWIPWYQRALAGETFTVEQNLTAGGRSFYFEITYNPIVSGGDVTGVAVFSRNVTERMETERRLRESEQRYRAVVEHQIDLVSRSRPDTTLTFVNDSYCRFFGKTRDELVGQSYLSLSPNTEHGEFLERFENWLRNPGVYTHEHQHINFRGEVHWIEWTDHAILDDDGKVIEIQSAGRDVTPRRLAEAALLESEQRYRAVVETQTEMVSRSTPDTILTFVNETYCRYFGKTRDELIGHSFLDLLAEEWREPILEQYAEMVKGGIGFTIEEEVIDANGDKRWQEWTNRAILDDQGEVVEFQSTGRDITERIHAEAALLESEQRYRAVVETQTEMVSRSTPDTILTFVNDAYWRYFGKTREELIGHSFLEQVPEEWHASIRDKFAAMLVDGIGRTDEHQVVDVNGELRWHEWTNRVIWDDQGKVVEFQSTGRDVTERKRAETERNDYIQRLEILQRLDVELSQTLKLDYVLEVALDAAVRISGANAGAIHLLEEDGRIRVAQVIGDYPRSMVGSFMPPNQGLISRVVRTWRAELVTDVSQDADYLATVAATRTQITVPLIAQDRLIGTLNVQTSYPRRFTSQIFDFVKLLSSRIAAALDNARLYQVLRQHFDDLQSAHEKVSGLEQLKSQIIRIAAHDLRNPLGVISGYLQMIDFDEDLQLPDRTRDQLNIIRDSADRIDKISADILTLERVQRGIVTEVVNFTEMVRTCYHDHVAQAGLKKHEFQLEPLVDVTLQGDPILLRETVSNLMSNAIRYTPDGGRVVVRLNVQDNRVIFQVEDNGYGIPADKQADLFKPFYRVKTKNTRDIKGSGLGLSLVKNIVEAHEGKVRFVSVEDQGSTFGFELPLPPPAPPIQPEKGKGKGKKGKQ